MKESHPRPASDERTAEPASSLPLAEIHVLLVDDEKQILKAYARALTALGARVATAATISAAIAYTRRHAESIDVVVLDYLLPDGRSEDLVEFMRAHGCAAGLVLITGQSEQLARRVAIQLGACVPVIKPCNVAIVLAPAIAEAHRTAMRRRAPALPHGHVACGSDENAILEQVFAIFMALLHRAGLRPIDAAAIELCARGVPRGRGAKKLGISRKRLDARVSDGLGDLGADNSYALLWVLANQLSLLVDRWFAQDRPARDTLLEQVRVVAAAGPPDSEPASPRPGRKRLSASERSTRPRVRTKRAPTNEHEAR